MARYELSDKEVEDLVRSLNMRCACIETGDVTLRRNDAIDRKQNDKIKRLSPEQETLISSMDSLSKRLMIESSKSRLNVQHEPLPAARRSWPRRPG